MDNYKLLLIGNPRVGKTAFLSRYVENVFLQPYVKTVGIDFRVKQISIKGKAVKLQIWDTAGEERYKTITTAYYSGAMGFILMFDLTSDESFQAVRGWVDGIKEKAVDNVSILLVGNKLDLLKDRVVTTEEANEVAQELGLRYIETSAKDNINVSECFEFLVEEIEKKYHSDQKSN